MRTRRVETLVRRAGCSAPDNATFMDEVRAGRETFGGLRARIGDVISLVCLSTCPGLERSPAASAIRDAAKETK